LADVFGLGVRMVAEVLKCFCAAAERAVDRGHADGLLQRVRAELDANAAQQELQSKEVKDASKKRTVDEHQAVGSARRKKPAQVEESQSALWR
jgi:hypothetical protein